MADLIAAITAIVNASIGWITSFVGVITDTPLLLMFVLVGFVGLGVGLLRRLMKL